MSVKSTDYYCQLSFFLSYFILTCFDILTIFQAQHTPIHSTKMVLSAAQITSFFEDADQMGLTHRTRTLSLNSEEIITVGELSEWKDDDWDQWNNNCKKPDRITDPANYANLIHQTPFAISVKSLKRLKAASELIRYYESVSIELTATKIRWPVIENYKIQWKAIYLRIKQTVPDVPKIVKTTTVA